jgi:anti-sigma B factor antagonist
MTPPPRVVIQTINDVTIARISDTHIRDLPQIEQIGKQLLDLVDSHGCTRLILDFAKVQTLSSQALGMLIRLERMISDKEGRLVLSSVRPEIGRLFEISRLHKQFKLVPDEASALSALGVTTAG